MTHLILSPRHTPDSNILWKAAVDLQWRINRLYKYRIGNNIADDTAKIYGENLFVEIIAQQLNVALLGSPPDWLAKLPNKYLKRNIQFMQLQDSRTIPTPAFIKPASGKLFDAKVYNSGQELPSPDVQDDATPVLVSEPVAWEIEFRCFIHNHKLLAISTYSRDGELNLDASQKELDDATDFCEQLLGDKTIQLPPSVVIDIGIIKECGWAVVEANPTFASGIYNCDAKQVLTCLTSACMPMNKLPTELTQWVLNEV